MRLVVADCAVKYSGRLFAELPRATRLIVVKADGTVVIHADAGAKPLNWMPIPNTLVEREGGWTVIRKDERLEIEIFEVFDDVRHALGTEPGLVKTGSEDELQRLLAAAPDVIAEGLRLVQREFRTDLGPVDLLLRDAEGVAVAVDVKRIGDIDGVEQLARYLERLNLDSALRPVRGIFVAQSIKQQAKVLAGARGIQWVEVDFDVLAGRVEPDLTLF